MYAVLKTLKTIIMSYVHKLPGYNAILYYNMYILYYFVYCQTLTDAMKTVCEILTADPEGGAARIPFPLFKELYTYLAQIDGDISQDQINEVVNHLQYDV